MVTIPLFEATDKKKIVDELNRLEREQLQPAIDMYDKNKSEEESEVARKLYNKIGRSMSKIRKENPDLFKAWKNSPFSGKTGRQPKI